MRIVGNRKICKSDIDSCVKIDSDGWDRVDGHDHQWYTLRYNPDCGLVILSSTLTRDDWEEGFACNDYFFDSPAEFANVYNGEDGRKDWRKLLGNIDEENEAAMDFADKALKAVEENW